jgi:F-type H+-transporting ATPase subunit b
MDAAQLTNLVGLLAVSAGGGEHGAHAGIDWFKLGSMITNAVVFFGFLAYKLSPAVRDGLRNRRATMEKALEEARRKSAEAEARAVEYERKMQNLEAEVERIVKSYEAEAQADRAKMEAETERAVERLARESEFTVRQELRKAERMIREAAVSATLEIAEQSVRTRITDADRRRLADQYISNLEKAAPGA